MRSFVIGHRGYCRQYWRKHGYIKQDGTPVKHKDEYRKIDGLLNLIDAKVELLPSSPNNYVLNKLKNDSAHAKMVRKYFDKIKIYNPKTCKSKNVIFVSGAICNGSNLKACYGIHFKGHEKFNVKSRSSEASISLPRALNVVKALGLKDVVIVTDNSLFLKCFYAGWKISPAKNYDYYNRIKELADELHVSSCFIRSESNDSDFKNSVILAQVSLEMSTTI